MARAGGSRARAPRQGDQRRGRVQAAQRLAEASAIISQHPIARCSCASCRRSPKIATEHNSTTDLPVARSTCCAPFCRRSTEPEKRPEPARGACRATAMHDAEVLALRRDERARSPGRLRLPPAAGADRADAGRSARCRSLAGVSTARSRRAAARRSCARPAAAAARRRPAGLQRRAVCAGAAPLPHRHRRRGRAAASSRAAGERLELSRAPGDAACAPGRALRVPSGRRGGRAAHAPMPGALCGRLSADLRRRRRCWRGTARLPLPPYIRRPTVRCRSTRERYQTVFARATARSPRRPRACTSPRRCSLRSTRRGVRARGVTLHVGPGNVPAGAQRRRARAPHGGRVGGDSAPPRPTRSRDARLRGRRVIAVGHDDDARARSRRRRRAAGGLWARAAFIVRRAFAFASSTRLLTNFHLPRSTLLMLVSALAGRETRAARRMPRRSRDGYRFYSYGDAMLIR